MAQASDSHATSLSASAVLEDLQKKKHPLVGGRTCSVGSSTWSPVPTAVDIPNDRPTRPVVTTAFQPLNLSNSCLKPPKVLKRTSGGRILTSRRPAFPASQRKRGNLSAAAEIEAPRCPYSARTSTKMTFQRLIPSLQWPSRSRYTFRCATRPILCP